jgi:hypothetical protein
MTQQEAIAAVGQSAVKPGYPKPEPYGSFLMLSTAPKPINSFDAYLLKFSAEGLFSVWARTSRIHSSADGAQVRSVFDDLRNLIASKYGKPTKCFDFRNAGTLDRPDFFMSYLKDEEQHLSCMWELGTHNATISLEAKGLDIDTAVVGVEYEFTPEFIRAMAVAEGKEKDSF